MKKSFLLSIQSRFKQYNFYWFIDKYGCEVVENLSDLPFMITINEDINGVNSYNFVITYKGNSSQQSEIWQNEDQIIDLLNLLSKNYNLQ